MDTKYLSVEHTSSMDVELNVMNYYTNICTTDIETEESTQIGHAIFNFYNTHLIGDWEDVLEAADGISGDELGVVSCLGFLEDEVEFHGKLIVLDSFQINDNYHNLGWGSQALKMMLDYWGYLQMDYIALKPAPLNLKIQGDERKKHITRLINFYQKFGFELLKGKQSDESYMGKNLNYL